MMMSPGSRSMSLKGFPTEVDESGTTDTFTIVLDAQPSDNVVIAMSSSDTGEATISGTISFTPANWDTAQPSPSPELTKTS
ncbi:MAG: hypothetical protein CM15mP49_29190 [Actinomycetota bacterium]|nr:MAG: hypothetical protein CM15mP49_29190 [Actinomycetota bacterium]